MGMLPFLIARGYVYIYTIPSWMHLNASKCLQSITLTCAYIYLFLIETTVLWMAVLLMNVQTHMEPGSEAPGRWRYLQQCSNGKSLLAMGVSMGKPWMNEESTGNSWQIKSSISSINCDGSSHIVTFLRQSLNQETHSKSASFHHDPESLYWPN